MGKIIAAHSFRGGTGKSSIVANTAASLACKGKRVCIIDTDIQSPGVHVFFGLQPENIKHSLNEYLWGKCSIEDAAMAITKDEVKDARAYLPDTLKHGYGYDRYNQNTKRRL
jgi:MinD-like ATPase involved in chromosome partitioning or flagellar assembly